VISGLVATLRSGLNDQDYQEIANELAANPAIEVGQICQQNRLPLTIETGPGWESEQLTRWISDQPNVEFVDVVCVHYEEKG